MANGWIKLHRKIADNWIWSDPEKLRAWLDLLLMVNHEDKEIPVNGKMMTIKRGQKLTSIVKLAERWKWNRKRVVRFLCLLEGSAMVTTKGSTVGTLITVVNWDFYQGEGSAIGSTVGTAVGTAKGTAVGTQTRMKRIKRKKEGAPPSDDEILAQLIARNQRLEKEAHERT